MVVFLVFLVAFSSFAIATILRGFVLSMLWGWFLVPIFGLPTLGIAAAIGISLVSTFLTYQHVETGENTNTGKRTAIILLHPLVALIVGAIVQMFM